SFEFVAAPWPPNERQIKAKIYLKAKCHSGARVKRANPESRDSGFIAARCPAMTGELRPRLQRLVDLGLEHGVDIIRRHRADHLVNDGAFATDDEGLRHAIDTPFDRGATVAVDADNAVRIAVAAEKAPRFVRRVLVVDADQLQPLVAAQHGPERRFRVARHAPPGPDVDDADLALEHGGIEPGHLRAVTDEALQRRQRGL